MKNILKDFYSVRLKNEIKLYYIKGNLYSSNSDNNIYIYCDSIRNYDGDLKRKDRELSRYDIVEIYNIHGISIWGQQTSDIQSIDYHLAKIYVQMGCDKVTRNNYNDLIFSSPSSSNCVCVSAEVLNKAFQFLRRGDFITLNQVIKLYDGVK